jgi:hypothetical protein
MSNSILDLESNIQETTNVSQKKVGMSMFIPKALVLIVGIIFYGLVLMMVGMSGAGQPKIIFNGVFIFLGLVGIFFAYGIKSQKVSFLSWAFFLWGIVSTILLLN